LNRSLGSFAANIKEIASHAGAQKYLMNTGWLFGEKILRLIAGLFVGAYVARYLGPSQFGLLNYVISVVSIFIVLADLGLESILVRELIRNNKSRHRLMGTAFPLKLFGSISSFLLLLLIINVANTDTNTSILFLIVGAGVIFESFKVIEFFFHSKVLSRFVVWSQMIALATVSIVRIILVQMDAGILLFAWTYSMDLLIFAVGCVYFYIKKGDKVFNWKFDAHLAIELIKTSWPLIFASLAVVVYMKIDQVMIKWMLGDEANGYYGVAVRLSEMWNFIPVAICSSVFPAILNAKAVSENLYLLRLQWLYDFMIFISLMIAVPVTFLSGYIVQALFGEAYALAGPITSIYIWSSVFVFLGVANGKWLISENLNNFRMMSLILAAGLNIVLNYILIIWIGLNGAAISTLLSYCFAAYLCLLFNKKTRPMFIQLTRSFNLVNLPKRLIDGFGSLK
jgi:O-antigen/teichoic acid export membrane protein